LWRAFLYLSAQAQKTDGFLMPLLEVTNLSAGYGERVVLNDISLAVEPGQMVGVLGPNGCGKSTLIKAISGLVKARKGTIVIAERPFPDLKPSERARLVGVVPQNLSLPDTFTASEVVMLGRTPHLKLLQNEKPDDWMAVEKAMHLTDCWHLAERYVGELSGGERQRVLLAMALAQQPRFLLLDEPTTFLDINYQTEMMEIVANWKSSKDEGQSRGVLAVFHELNLAAQYCDWLVLMTGGRVMAQGRPDEVINAENIYRAYGAKVLVVPHPLNQQPTTFIVPGGERNRTV
jgi:iron complex transport system ATP-binding protein